MNYLKYLTYSITLITSWALLSRLGIIPMKWGTLLALLYTFYSSYEIRRTVLVETSLLKVVKLIGPFTIITSYLVFNQLYWFSVINPLFILLITICLTTFFDSKNFPSRAVQFFTVSFIVIYSITVVPEWQRFYKNTMENQNPNFQLNELVTNTNPEPIANLNVYNFLNKELDTVNLANTGKYTIVETWNERCPPCIRAMKDLKPFYNNLGEKVQQRYVYVPARKGYKLDYPKIFSYKHIQDTDRILVDVNLQEVAELEGYPNFLVFDSSGKLVLQQHGYASAQREAFEAKIKETIGL